jgi:hypothetical protein
MFAGRATAFHGKSRCCKNEVPAGHISSEWFAVGPHPPAPLSQQKLGEGGWGVRAVSLATTICPTNLKCTRSGASFCEFTACVLY